MAERALFTGRFHVCCISLKWRQRPAPTEMKEKSPALLRSAARIWLFLCRSLAGVSRSTTMVVAYLMTVTHYSWDECLSAVKAVRSFVGPNYGFQQQLQEYQATQLSEVDARVLHTFTHARTRPLISGPVRTLFWQWFFEFSSPFLVTLAQHSLEMDGFQGF